MLGQVPERRAQVVRPVRGGARVGRNRPAGSAGGTLVLFTQTISGANAVGARTDDLQVRVDLTGWPDLPAGSYTGTLNLLVTTQ